LIGENVKREHRKKKMLQLKERNLNIEGKPKKIGK
jgi:hypothetical protein